MASEKPSFSTPAVASDSMWGPSASSFAVFDGIPYQPFSKQDRVGKIADFLGTQYHRYDRPTNAFGEGDAFEYVHDAEDKAFQLVDTTRVTKQHFRPKRFQFRRHQDQSRGEVTLSKNKSRERDRQRLEQKMQKKWGQTAKRRADRRTRRNLPTSIEIMEQWQDIKTVDFEKLDSAEYEMGPIKTLLSVGALNLYKKKVDRTEPSTAIDARASMPTYSMPMAMKDPQMQEFVKKNTASVYATERALTYLMTATRSMYSWDVIVRTKGDAIFFDVRDDGPVEHTIDENAFQAPISEGDINCAEALAEEAATATQMFQKAACLAKKVPVGKSGKVFDEAASVAYSYRLFDFEDGCKLVVRGEHNALDIIDKKPKFAAVKAMLEWDPVANGATDWRRKLVNQHGTVLATELRNNACKLARWALGSMLAGNGVLKLGYVSRVTPESNTAHQILATETFTPAQLGKELKLSLANGWGIVRSLINLFESQENPDGWYVVYHGPGEENIKVYQADEESLFKRPKATYTEDGQAPVGILDIGAMQ
eukprot:m.354533 g.354533  ORF g.354533 m.354533 type:complete len:537 (-) comp17048_c0_seq1:2277-3887(-)